MKKIFGVLLLSASIVLVVIVAIYAAAYYAVAEGWTNVEGEVDAHSLDYQQNYTKTANIENPVYGPSDDRTQQSRLIDCQLRYLQSRYPKNASKIENAFQESGSEELISRMIFATSLRMPESEELKGRCDLSSISGTQVDSDIFLWINTEEWPIITEAIDKDRELIEKASSVTDLDSRLLMMPLAVEQLRLYFSQREFYEKFFKPMKILVSTNQMAWGVMAIKEKSAEKIENNLKDKSSPFYLGAKYEHLLDLTTDDPVSERASRLNNDKEHYWSYLYGALYIKELMAQWEKAGYSIEKRPEVIATLYNLGFERSKPKENPEVGGSTLDIAGGKYTFGGLGFEIFYSGELMESFPYNY